MNGFSAEGFGSPRVYGHICPADGCEDTEGILGCILQGCVSMDGAHAQQVQPGMMGGEEDSKSILRIEGL